MSIYKGKQLFFVDSWHWTTDKEHDWQFSYILIDPIYNKQLDDFNNNIVQDVQEGSTLFFGKTSNFPRFKIKDLNYKRCIKVEKSDYQVIGELKYDSIKNVYIFEGKDVYYAIANLDRETMYDSNGTYYKKLSLSLDEKIKYIEQKLNVNLIEHHPKMYTCSRLVWEDLENIASGKFTNCVTDDILDKIVNKNMDDMSIEDVDLLNDLLNSNDPNSLELGLKMLVGYNVSEYPVTTRLLLYNNNLTDTKAWNSVGVKQVRDSCSLKGTGWNLRYSSWYLLEDKENISDKDLELVHHLWKKKVTEIENRNLEFYNIPGLKFSCHAE